jgi:hypothetical protein
MARSKKSRGPLKPEQIIFTRYWVWLAKSLADGTLIIHTTGHFEDRSHADGKTTVKPGELDYPLWQWLLNRREEGSPLPDYISNTDLDNYRAEFMTSAA